MNNGIQVIYPKSKYKKLNDEVFLLIQREILQFMVIARNKQEDKFTHTLEISHDEYSYQDYLSFVFSGAGINFLRRTRRYLLKNAITFSARFCNGHPRGAWQKPLFRFASLAV